MRNVSKFVLICLALFMVMGLVSADEFGFNGQINSGYGFDTPTANSGQSGTNGSVGPQGPQGPPGINGTNGVNGSQGPQGPTGPQGPAGVNGSSSFTSLNDTQFDNSTGMLNIVESWLRSIITGYLGNVGLTNQTNIFQGNQYVNGSIFADNICYANGTNCPNQSSSNVSGFVPYTGATGDVDLGQHNITVANIRIPTNGIVNMRADDPNALPNDTYFTYNNITHRFELWVNMKLQQDWGNSTTIYGVATFEANAFFKNLSGDTVILDGSLNVTKNISAQFITAPNLCYSSGINCFFNGTTIVANLTDYINYINSTLSIQIYNLSTTKFDTTSGPYLYSNGTIVYFNESQLNGTIKNLAQVRAYNSTITIITSGGSGTGTTPNLNGFQITRITVTPSSNSSQYRFLATLQSSSEIVDQDRMNHVGIWSIRKSQAVYNDSVVYSITQSNPAVETYNVKVEYINNFQP